MPRASIPQREVNEKGERSSRIRPGRVRQTKTLPPRITGTAKNLFRLVRLVSRSSPGGAQATSAFSRLPGSAKPSAFQRRCIVNVRYASTRTPGGWKAHGTYIERESAKGDRLPSEREAATEIAAKLPIPTALDWRGSTRSDGWRRAGKRQGTRAVQDYPLSRRRKRGLPAHRKRHGCPDRAVHGSACRMGRCP